MLDIFKLILCANISFQLHIGTSEEVNSPTNKDVDFFKEHEEEGTKLSDWTSSVPTTTAAQHIPVSNGTLSKEQQLFGMHHLLDV